MRAFRSLLGDETLRNRVVVKFLVKGDWPSRADLST
jgi:hypothetical protein